VHSGAQLRARTKRESERIDATPKAKVAEGRHRSTALRMVADLSDAFRRRLGYACQPSAGSQTDRTRLVG
jgi:hypothetical protein